MFGPAEPRATAGAILAWTSVRAKQAAPGPGNTASVRQTSDVGPVARAASRRFPCPTISFLFAEKKVDLKVGMEWGGVGWGGVDEAEAAARYDRGSPPHLDGNYCTRTKVPWSSTHKN